MKTLTRPGAFTNGLQRELARLNDEPKPEIKPEAAPARPKVKRAEGSDGQPRGSSSQDVADAEDEKQRKQKQRADKSKAAANDEAEVGSPGSERGAIGPIGDTANVVGQMSRRPRPLTAHELRCGAIQPRGMQAFTNGLIRDIVVNEVAPQVLARPGLHR